MARLRPETLLRVAVKALGAALLYYSAQMVQSLLTLDLSTQTVFPHVTIFITATLIVSSILALLL